MRTKKAQVFQRFAALDGVIGWSDELHETPNPKAFLI